MANDRKKITNLRLIQHPVISRASTPETILQFLFLGGIVAILEWVGVSFEFTLLFLLVLGFTLNTMNVIAAAVSQNVHLAEIRDQILSQNEQANR